MTTTRQAIRKILVVGGNGFIGSAVCRAALARGMQVTSVSSSGTPYTTPKGHSPAWTSKVTWLRGNALHPETSPSFTAALPEADAVVHTLGTLIEGGGYKQALKDGDILGGIRSLFGDGGNPLTKDAEKEREGSYEVLNRDSALRVCEAFVSSGDGRTYPTPRPFVYISAEDIFRPLIPTRYIETKRQAERGIEGILAGKSAQYRGVYIRPSLVYHAHFRPLTTPAATLLDLSSVLHSKVPRGIPTPASTFRSLGSMFTSSPESLQASQSVGSSPNDSEITTSPLESMANALTIPPIHVDHVANAICVALDSASEVRGVVGVRQMRKLLGWKNHARDSDSHITPAAHRDPGI